MINVFLKDDCRKFYSCVFDGSHYIAYHFTCPANLAFDDTSKKLVN